jgi:hypothetical protein
VSSAGSSHEQAHALEELIEQVRALSARINTLDERERGRSVELQDALDNALHALELAHDDDPDNRRRLRELRAGAAYERAFTTPDPLVSVVIPAWNRVDTLIDRAIPSALAQTHANIEVIVVGDASPPEIGAAVQALDDPRIAFRNLTIRGPYLEDRFGSWAASGTPGLNAGVALARGSWIAPLGDDDAFVPEHIERLLSKAQTSRLEFVYGRIRTTYPDGTQELLGEFPPKLGQINLQAAIYHAGLRFMEMELGHALFGKPNDWGLIHRMMRVGVRFGMIDDVTVDYWASMRGYDAQQKTEQPPGPQALTDQRIGELETQSSDLRARLLELERSLSSERERRIELEAYAGELTGRLEEVRRSRSWRFTAPLRRLRSGT